MTRSLIRAAVISALAELTSCPAEEISDSEDLVEDLRVDSLTAVNLLLAIEDKLETRLPEGGEGSFVDVRTVGELVERFATVCMPNATASPQALAADR